MLKLMKLELERNKLITYIVASLFIFAFGLGFCFLLACVPQLEQMMGGGYISAKMRMMTEWSNFISVISILFVAAFGVLSAVMHARFTVEAYTGKRAILLFSYPVKRSKVLFAKCGLVFFFTVITGSICNVVAISIFAFFSNTFSLLPNLFTDKMWFDLLTTAGISALLAGAIGLVAMRIGFWRKSLVVTVVTSFLLAAPFGNTVSLFPDNSLVIQLIGMIVLLAIGFAVFAELLSKVNKMEAL